MLTLKFALIAASLISIAGCVYVSSREHSAANGTEGAKMDAEMQEPRVVLPKGAKAVVVAGGCFWCIEALFDELKGVYWAENGYAGGDDPNPTYNKVLSGGTGHAEAVKIVYDPMQVSGDDLLRYFFALHDPTTLNRQGPDSGPQYRSAIFYANDEERVLAERIKNEISDSKLWKSPIVTTIEPLKNYKMAEAYHQDYFVKYEKASPAERLSMNAGYCSAIIEPKVRKFREKFADKLKKKP